MNMMIPRALGMDVTDRERARRLGVALVLALALGVDFIAFKVGRRDFNPRMTRPNRSTPKMNETAPPT